MAESALIDRELAIGLLVVGAGLIVVAFPGPFAMMNEAFDAIGSKRSDVEPTRWRLLLTRVIGVGVIIAGVWFLVEAYNIGTGV